MAATIAALGALTLIASVVICARGVGWISSLSLYGALTLICLADCAVVFLAGVPLFGVLLAGGGACNGGAFVREVLRRWNARPAGGAS